MGFPLSYCLLSTATSVDICKQMKALTVWANCLQDTYGVIPKFAHVDKDMVEISMLRTLWKLKIQLCWWHIQKVVREWLSEGKLAMMPYNASRAQAEFAFISLAFIPYGKPDTTEYESGNLEDPKTDEAPKPNPNSITI